MDKIIIEGVPYFQESEGRYLDWEDYKKEIHPHGWGHPSPQMMKIFVDEFVEIMNIFL